MVNATCPKLITDTIRCSESEIGDSELETVVEAEDILRLQVSVINAQRVAVLDGVEELEEDVLDEAIVSEVSSLVKDLREEVAIWAIVHDEVNEGTVLDDSMEGYDVGM